MIFEVAVEPELVAEWDHLVLRLLKGRFGPGRPCILARLPGNWRRLALQEIARRDPREPNPAKDLIRRLDIDAVSRNFSYDPVRSWLDNAETAHHLRPFHAIGATQNPRCHPAVKCRDEVIEAIASIEDGALPPGTAEDIAQTLEPMLRMATRLLVVDPYFAPWDNDHREPFAQVIRRAKNLTGPVDVFVRAEGAFWSHTDEAFERACRRYLAASAGPNVNLRFLRVERLPDGGMFHDRFVLADVGGVCIGAGLEARGPTTEYTVNRLSRSQYDLLWSRYAGLNPAFRTCHTFTMP